MELAAWLEVWGYPALAAGVLLEGETALLIGGGLAARGLLLLPLVMVSAFTACFASDQLLFLLGRHGGRAWLATRPRWRVRAAGMRQLLRRRGWLVFGFRFVYGLRVLAPLAIGSSGYPWGRFALLNALAGGVWVAAVASAGLLVGEGVARALEAGSWISALPAAALLLALVSCGLLLVRHQRGLLAEPVEPGAPTLPGER